MGFYYKRIDSLLDSLCSYISLPGIACFPSEESNLHDVLLEGKTQISPNNKYGGISVLDLLASRIYIKNMSFFINDIILGILLQYQKR